MARSPAGTRQLATEIAELESIPRRFLDSILRRLAQHGLLVSSRGRRGGYALRTSAGEISVAAVVEILDGSAFTFPCLSWRGAARCAECPGSLPCPAELAFSAMGSVAKQTLGAITIADLIARGDATSPEDSIRTLSGRLEPESPRLSARKVGRVPKRSHARQHLKVITR